MNGLFCYGNILVLNPEQENGLVRVGAVHRVRVLRGPGGKNKIQNNMDKITFKTPNPQCRLYWCLIEFIDWRYSQSCWYFRPALL